jgi:hypothetical protein
MVHRSIPIRAQLPNRHEVQVTVDANATVRDLKQAILTAAPHLGSKTSDFRVLQRSMELHEQATLLYYHIADATTLQVVKKVINTDRPSGGRSQTNGATGGSSAGPSADSSVNGNGVVAQQQQYAVENRREQARQQLASSLASTSKPPAGAPASKRPASAGPARSQSAAPAGTSTAAGTRGAPLSLASSIASWRPTSAGGNAAPNRFDSAAAQRANPGDVSSASELDDDDAIVRRLEAGILALQRDVGLPFVTPSAITGSYPLGTAVGTSSIPTVSNTTFNTTTTGGNPYLTSGSGDAASQQRILQLEQRLRNTESKYNEAVERINELEATVRRYQQLLRRATQFGGALAGASP